MSATLVTGYVRLDSPHRSHREYLDLGRRLFDLGLPTVAFWDGPPGDLDYPHVDLRPASLDRCWLHEPARGAASPAGVAGGKDGVSYMVVQNQKSAWLADSAEAAEMLIWIDWGIFHLGDLQRWDPGPAVRELVAWVDAEAPRDRITMPTIWPITSDIRVRYTEIQWYAAGGVLIMPAAIAGWFDQMVREYAMTWLRSTKLVTWEVNLWAAVARDCLRRFRCYPCDHNQTILQPWSA